MATFAQLNSNTVINVIKVRNTDITITGNQTEEEAGIIYLQNIFPGTNWKQVFWGSLPSIGYIYDPITGEFTEHKPEPEIEEEEETEIPE